ncbi:MAG TPA: alpha/beta hydrolase [Duganella sp.]|jgi:pimeloyl-ACP methyl ester carboxylesterase
MMTRHLINKPPSRKTGAALAAAGILAASWLVVRSQTRKVEREHPAAGQFVTVDGVRLHYLSEGTGPVVVLLHGNGVTAEDYRHSGMFDQLASTHRVIAFDRPGFGYSDRPRGTVWTPEAQATLLVSALEQLGVSEAVVFAHSWSTLVALSMATARPDLVRGLVLASGYYYPSVRLDVLGAVPAVPLIGDVMRYTLSPLVARLIWPLAVKRAFAPLAVPDSFKRMPPWMALRPGQLRAEAEETAMMIPSAAALREHYPELDIPVSIIAGAEDAIVSAGHNSEQLHRDIAGSELTLLPGAGHMIQHLSQQTLIKEIERVQGYSKAPRLTVAQA